LVMDHVGVEARVRVLS